MSAAPEILGIERRLALLEDALKAMPGLKSMLVAPQNPMLFKGILRDASELFGLQEAELVDQGRRFAAVRARYAIAWTARLTTSLSFVAIAHALGRSDHTTMIAGVQRADEMRADDQAFRRVTDEMLERATQRRGI